jgi:hypothetical protein
MLARITLPALVMVMALTAVVFAPSAAARAHVDYPTLTILGHDGGSPGMDHYYTVNGVNAPAIFPAGYVKVTFRDVGDGPHQAQIFRLRPGVTEAQFIQVLATGSVANFEKVSWAWGGANVIMPRTQQTIIENFPVGHYVVVCFVTDGPNSPPHFLMGMHISLYATDQGNTATAPSTRWTIHTWNMGDNFGFKLPAYLPSGQVTVRVFNEGMMVHEVSLNRVPNGTTKQEVWDCLLGKPTCTLGPNDIAPAGGNGAMQPRATSWFIAHLQPGTYAVLCFVPDDDGIPHALKGMIGILTVR